MGDAMNIKTDPMQGGFTLEDILRDTLDSTYIDDAYYAKLRNDMVEWDGKGTLLSEAERHIYEALITEENWLLDRRAFERWYQLYSRKCVYWVPAVGDLPDPVRADPQRQVTIAFDDRRRLGDRIVWLRTGVAYSQLPPSYTSHISTAFVRMPSENKSEVKVRSQFLIQEMRAGHEIQTFSGWMGHVFVEEDGITKIDRKVVCLLDAPRSHHNMTFLL